MEEYPALAARPGEGESGDDAAAHAQAVAGTEKAGEQGHGVEGIEHGAGMVLMSHGNYGSNGML